MSDPPKDNPQSIILLETLAAGPLKVGATPPRPGLMGAFEHYGKRLLKHPFFPWVGRWMMIGFLIALAYSAFFGPRDPRLNFATVMSWVVWWPLLAISYLVVGRVWCAVCPMGALSDIVHRRIGLNLKAPELFKKRWLVAVLLGIAILYQAWIEEVTRASVSPLITGFILWSFTIGAVVSGLVFERWTWCRHLCPLGAWSGVFAMSSVVEVRADPNVCLANHCKGIYCYFGRDDLPGCPFHQVPKIMETNRYCSTCGNCLKACPNDAISIRLRPPSREFVTQKKEVLENALISVVAIGVVIFQGLVMTEPWATLREYAAASLPLLSNDAVLYGALILACVGLATGLFFLASQIYARLTHQSCHAEMCRFGFAFLPLALLTHIGHNLGHLFNGYALVPGALAGLVGKLPQAAAEGAPNLWLWQVLEIGLVVVGLIISVWAIRRICGAAKGNCPRPLATAPYMMLAILYAAVFIALFALPMVTRVS
ncbi:MAG: 4Fe-4S binding protein [Anaerolineales bacterium]|nr:4Fe-4S binding protein [Anaerolineales bacterium]